MVAGSSGGLTKCFCLSSGLAFRCLIGVLLGFEDNAFVEFGEGKFDPDLGEGENGVCDQDFVRPRLARAGVDCRADAILFEHDIALDGWGA